MMKIKNKIKIGILSSLLFAGSTLFGASSAPEGVYLPSQTPSPVEEVVFSPNGKYLASRLARSGFVVVWDAENKNIKYKFRHPDGHVKSIAFSEDSLSLVALVEITIQPPYYEIFILDLPNNRIKSQILLNDLNSYTNEVVPTSEKEAVTLSPNGKYVVFEANVLICEEHSRSKEFWLYNIGTREVKRIIAGFDFAAAYRTAFSINSKYFIVQDEYGSTWKVSLQKNSNSIINGKLYEHTSRIFQGAVSSDGNYFGFVGNYEFAWSDFTDSPQIRCRKFNKPSDFTCIAICPNSKFIVAGSFDQYVLLYDLKNENYVQKIGPFETNPTSATFSPDGKKVAIGLSDGSVFIQTVTVNQNFTAVD